MARPGQARLGRTGTGPRAIELTERRARALRMRATGMAYVAIGKALGVDQSTAHDDVRWSLAHMVREPCEDVLALELGRLDRMLRGVLGPASRGDTAAIASVLAVQARRAKYLGLDAPEKTQAVAPGLTLDTLDLSPLSVPEVRALLEMLARTARTELARAPFVDALRMLEGA